MEEVQLIVEKAYPIDLGRGVIRLDPTALVKLQLDPGDCVEILGKKKTTAKVWRADRQDWEQGIVRIDNFIRQNAGVSIGEKVTIKKVDPPKAKKLILALLESMTQGGPELQLGEHPNEIIKRHILKRPVFNGDIVPIINSMSQPMTESLTTSQVIPLIAIRTEPSDVIIKVSEETEVELVSNVVQSKTAQTQFENSKAKLAAVKVQPEGSKAEINTIAAKLDYIQAKLNNITAPNIDTNRLFNQAITSLIADKKDEDTSIITLSENIVKTKAHCEEIGNSIEKYSTDYVIEASKTQSLLKDVMNKSDKAVYEYIYNLKFQDAFNYIKDLDSKLELYHKAALSEIAHRKIKEIEFQINSPFFTSKLRKNHKKLVSEFDKLDTAGIQGTKSNKEFTEKSEELMEKLQEMEEGVGEEQKTGIRGTLKTIIFWGIPVLFSFYSLVADEYFKVNFYTPIAFYIFLSGIVYLFLKSGVNLNIMYQGYKSNLLGLKDAIISPILPLIISFTVPFIFYLVPGSINEPSTPTSISLPNIIVIGVLIIFTFSTSIVISKDYVKNIKQKLIENEIDNLVRKYELDTSVVS